MLGAYELSPQVLAAIIGAAAVIGAAIIGILAKRKKPSRPYDKMALGLRLGFHSIALYYWIKLSAAIPTGEDQQAAAYVGATISEDNDKCEAISKQLGITFTARSAIKEGDPATHDLAIYRSRIDAAIAALPINVQSCIDAGQRMGSAFYRVFLMLFVKKMRGDSAGANDVDATFVGSIENSLDLARQAFTKAGLKPTLLNEPNRIVQVALSRLTQARHESTEKALDSVIEIHESMDVVAGQIADLRR